MPVAVADDDSGALGLARGLSAVVHVVGGETEAVPTSKKNWWVVSFPTIIIVATVCIVFVLGKDYIKGLLMYVESLDAVTSVTIFLALFTSVSFPICWGYVLLNLAVGYLYGVLRGTVLTSLCALTGVTIAHVTIRRYIRNCVMRLFESNDQFSALMVVISGNQAYRLVLFTRLTPLPFGLQNSLFAVSKIDTIRYLAASFAGLLPTQVLFTYMGSTLRSMEEVFSDGNTIMGWIIFSVQIMFSAGLTFFIVRKAKLELNNAVIEQNRILHEADSLPSPVRNAQEPSENDAMRPHVIDVHKLPGRHGPDSVAYTNKDRSLPNVHDFRTFA